MPRKQDEIKYRVRDRSGRKISSAELRTGLQKFLTEERLGEQVRDACKQLGWQFYWLRKTYNSSRGILDLLLVPDRLIRAHLPDDKPGALYRRHILHRELKGHDRRGRMGKTSPEQDRTIDLINIAGGDAAVWTPEDWFSGKILEELQ